MGIIFQGPVYELWEVADRILSGCLTLSQRLWRNVCGHGAWCMVHGVVHGMVHGMVHGVKNVWAFAYHECVLAAPSCAAA